MTIEEIIEHILLERVRTLPMNPVLPIAYPNLAFKPPLDGSPYLEVRLLPNSNQRIFYGSTDELFRMGILQINIVMQENKGVLAGTRIAGQITGHFPQDLVLRENDIKVQLQKAPDVGAALPNPTGTNWIVPVSIYYEAYA
jgi:hypothetical protein